MAYLMVICSVVAFSVYAWLVTRAPLSLVVTHAYVNPVVAVLLGWLVLSEPIGPVVLVGGGIVVASVVVVISATRLEGTRSPAAAEEIAMVVSRTVGGVVTLKRDAFTPFGGVTPLNG